MILGSFRFLSVRCSRSRSSLPGALKPGITTCFRSCSSVSVPAAENAKDSVIDLALNSVVIIFCQSAKSSVLQPWQKRLPQLKTGSEFVISRNKILTNAHVVSDHTFVQVRKHGSPTKYKAKVEAVGHDCDLAILVINSKKFWEDMKPLDLGNVPSLYENVFVVGYPRGGDNISITKGVVSRVEVTNYAHSRAKLMTIQIDAAINPGNSGGPVFRENKVVGVAFQENGQFPGFCSLGIWCQHMENALIRNYFKMTTKMTGVLIKAVNPLSSSYSLLKKDDVLLSVDGSSIGNDATGTKRLYEEVCIKNHEFTGMKSEISYRSTHEFITLVPQLTLWFTILNAISIDDSGISPSPPESLGDAIISFDIGIDCSFSFVTFVDCGIADSLSPRLIRSQFHRTNDMNEERDLISIHSRVHHTRTSAHALVYNSESLIPAYQFDKLPSYYIQAGFVFSPLTQPYIYAAGKYDSVLKHKPKKAGEQILVFSQVLEDDNSVGYTTFKDSKVKKVNGVRVENLNHLRKLIEESCTENLRLDLEDDDTIIIISHKSAKNVTPKILKRYGIPMAMSKDLQSL
ncbi:unnamed protein product, partial [Thlaspi arvense]